MLPNLGLQKNKSTAFAVLQSVEKAFFGRLPEVERPPKTSKTNASAYKGTVAFVLRSKSKSFLLKAIVVLFLFSDKKSTKRSRPEGRYEQIAPPLEVLLRCPAWPAPGEAGLPIADRCHSLPSLHPPPAALRSLPPPPYFYEYKSSGFSYLDFDGLGVLRHSEALLSQCSFCWRYRPDSFAFLPIAKIEVRLRPAVAGHSPPDCGIGSFKSVLLCSKQKSPSNAEAS